MNSKRPQLVVFFSKKGKALKACCSACGTRVRRRGTKEYEEALIEVFCPDCDSRLLVVPNLTELERCVARGAELIQPVKRRRN